jgi:membrane associated rhomboid family serine protease
MTTSFYRYQQYNYYRPSLFGGFRFFPKVIKYLLISNVALFLLVHFFALFKIQGVPLSPYLMPLFALYPLGHGFQIWQLFTYMFMHGDFWHLALNMFALWMFGMDLENDWGSKRFAWYYFLCGLGAGISNLLISPLFGTSGPTIGASGAVYGILLAFGMTYPNRPIFVYFLLPLQAKYFVLIYLVLELYNGVTGTMDGIAHFAHLGGAAVGFLILSTGQRFLPVQKIWERTKERFTAQEHATTRSYRRENEVSDAQYYDITDEESRINQQRVDEILDKISQYGYQSLTEEEKRILFEASKKLN